MKHYRLSHLTDTREGHFLSSIVAKDYINKGRMSFKGPGERTHSGHIHVHDEPEVFVILQGRGRMEVNGMPSPVEVGDILIVEPGENHHLASDEEDPCIILWLHMDKERHIDQLPRSAGS